MWNWERQCLLCVLLGRLESDFKSQSTLDCAGGNGHGLVLTR
jgi:hypothetical protein